MLVDSHCHLEYEGLVDKQAEVLDRARAAGVGAFLNISTKQEEWDQVVGTATHDCNGWATRIKGVWLAKHQLVNQE